MNNRTIITLGQLIEKIIEKITDILLPKEDKVRLLENLGVDGLFENIPRAQNFDIQTQADFDDQLKAIFCYKNTLCRQAIWEIKYRANKKLIRDFSLLLYDFLLEEINDLKTFHGFDKIILLPIPTSSKRLREKGFNQCLLICRELIRIDKERNSQNFILLENFLTKKHDTVRQARVSNRKARLKNLIDAFSTNTWPDTGNNPFRLTRTNHCGGFPDVQPLNNHSEGFPDSQLLTSYSFIIIDDVITTGATMTEAFRALKNAGISPRKIRGYSLAH